MSLPFPLVVASCLLCLGAPQLSGPLALSWSALDPSRVSMCKGQEAGSPRGARNGSHDGPRLWSTDCVQGTPESVTGAHLTLLNAQQPQGTVLCLFGEEGAGAERVSDVPGDPGVGGTVGVRDGGQASTGD